MSAMVTQECAEDQCHACRGDIWTRSADLPYACEHDCHRDIGLLDDFDDEAEQAGDAARFDDRFGRVDA